MRYIKEIICIRQGEIKLDFWTTFKDYLPILTGVFTLTSAGVFGILLADLKHLREQTNQKYLETAVQTYTDLDRKNLLSENEKQQLKDNINFFKHKVIEDLEETKANGKSLQTQRMAERFIDSIKIAIVISCIEIGFYWITIDTLSKQKYFESILVIIVGIIIIFALKRIFRLMQAIFYFMKKITIREIIKIKYRYSTKKNHLQ